MTSYQYQTIAIGAGAAGLVIGIGSAKAGHKALLIDKGHWGGDCTNFGCVPSKTLIAEAHKLHAARQIVPDLDVRAAGAAALKRVRSVVTGFVSHEDPPALKEHGVDTLTGRAQLVDSHTVRVGGQEVKAQNIVLCTGSHPFIPPISGLENTPFLTNESIFALETIPESLVILGGGAIGCEMAQAFARLGAQVTLVEALPRLLGREEAEASAALARRLEADGVTLCLGAAVHAVSYGERFSLELEGGKRVEAAACLVAVGRRPNVEGLGLEKVGVDYSPAGIKVDNYGRSSVKTIWAAGDCNGRSAFTHSAEAEARAVLTSLILPWPLMKRLPTQPIPRVTYTDPEVAAIGLTEEQAKITYGERRIAVYTVPLENIDRAVCVGMTDGFVKIITKKWSSKIVGASIVSPSAGEILMEISGAMAAGTPLRKLSGLIHPYPIYGRGVRKAADQWLSHTILPALRGK